MKKTALVIIDVQKGMFLETDPVYKGEELLHNINELLAKARSKGIPIFYIQHEAIGQPLEYGTEGWEIHEKIAPLPRDIMIQKKTPDSFYQTSLDVELKKRDIRHVVLAGIQSDVCVDTTCRRAFSMGYKVTLVTDAHSTWDTQELTAQQVINHHNRVLRWFAEGKETLEITF